MRGDKQLTKSNETCNIFNGVKYEEKHNNEEEYGVLPAHWAEMR
jgi:hypothetical protein